MTLFVPFPWESVSFQCQRHQNKLDVTEIGVYECYTYKCKRGITEQDEDPLGLTILKVGNGIVFVLFVFSSKTHKTGSGMYKHRIGPDRA